MSCHEPRTRRDIDRWARRAVTVTVLTVALVLLARGAWADCTSLWDSASPDCLVRRAGGAIASGIAGKIAEGVSWLAKQIGDGARTAGRPDVMKSWFTDTFATMRHIGVLFAVVGMLLSLIYAALKRDVHEIGRTLTRVLAAGLTTGGIAIVVATAIHLVDAVCDYTLGPRGWAVVTDTLKRPVELLGRISGKGGPASPTLATPSVIAILIGLLMLIALAIIWIELFIRRIAIDLCVLFWPLAVSGAVWANARLWTRRLVETIAGLVLSKLLIVIVLKYAAAALHNMRSVSDLLMGVGVFALAALAPFWVMRMIGFVGGAIQPGHTGEGLRSAAVGAATATAMTVSRVGAAVTSGGWTALAGAGGALGGSRTAGGMLAGGRTPMPDQKAKRPDDQGRTQQFTPGGRGTASRDQREQDTAVAGRATDAQRGRTAESQETPQTRSAPEPPPMPRTYSGSVPSHLRSAPTTGGSDGSSPESTTGSTGTDSRTPGRAPGTRPAAPPSAPPSAPPTARPPARGPQPWPGPRQGDPSAPMRRPQPPSPPPRSAPPQPPPPPDRG